MKILPKTKFSIQVDESTSHLNCPGLYQIHPRRIEILIIKSLPETTASEDIFNEVMQYFRNKNIPLINLINIASDGVAAMTGKVKRFIYRMKSVAPHIFHILYVIHIQHLIAKNTGGDMEEALNAVKNAITFVKSSSVNDRFYCNSVNTKFLIPYCFTQK